MSAPELLWVAICREGTKTPPKPAIGNRLACLAQVEAWGPADGRSFIVGPLMDLLDFFVDPNTPEAQELTRQAACFERAVAGKHRVSLDAPNWLRGGRRRDPAVLMCMGALAVAQGGIPAVAGKLLQTEIAGVLRATERAH